MLDNSLKEISNRMPRIPFFFFLYQCACFCKPRVPEPAPPYGHGHVGSCYQPKKSWTLVKNLTRKTISFILLFKSQAKVQPPHPKFNPLVWKNTCTQTQISKYKVAPFAHESQWCSAREPLIHWQVAASTALQITYVAPYIRWERPASA